MKIILFLPLLLGIVIQAANAKVLEKVSIDGAYGVSSHFISNIPNAELDFMNYMTKYGFFDNAYITSSIHLWFNKGQELYLEGGLDGLAYEVMITDIRFRQPLGKGIKLNLGFNNNYLMRFSLTEHYTNNKEYQNYLFDAHSDNNINNYHPRNIGPYSGLSYSFSKGGLTIEADMNLGLAFNHRRTFTVYMFDTSSNYIQINEYKLVSNPSVWLNSEIGLKYALLNLKRFELGFRLKSEFTLSKKGLNYTLYEHKWIYENPDITREVFPWHRYNFWNNDFGIYLLLK